jgi:hypothetical protein
VIELISIWIEKATRSTECWIEKETGLKLVSTETQIWPRNQAGTGWPRKWNVRVTELIGNWTKEAIELIAGLIEGAIELTGCSTAKVSVGTGVWIVRDIWGGNT